MAENKFLVVDGKFVINKGAAKFGTAQDPVPTYVDIDLDAFNLSYKKLTIVEDR